MNLSVLSAHVVLLALLLCSSEHVHGWLIKQESDNLVPIVIIPGTGASQLEAKLDRDQVVAPHCQKKADWFRLWLNVWDIVFALVSWGHVRGTTVRGAPYDFRYAPHSQHKHLANLKLLVEETYRMNDNRQVALLAHSYGGLFGLYFLNQQSQVWKDKYVQRYITVGTPWAGSAREFRLFASGSVYKYKFADPYLVRKQQITYETNVQMIPDEDLWGDQVFVETSEKSYTAMNIDKFFQDVGFPTAIAIKSHFNGRDYDVRHPGVNMTCIHSNGIDTPIKYKYDTALNTNPQPVEIVNGQGDGTVNLESLEACEQMNTYGQFSRILIADAEHTALLKDTRLFAKLKDILS